MEFLCINKTGSMKWKIQQKNKPVIDVIFASLFELRWKREARMDVLQFSVWEAIPC
jgi:hypothetical protein